MNILINQQGRVFTERGGNVAPVSADNALPAEYADLAAQLEREPGAHFFKTPYHQVALVKDGQVVDLFDLTPGDFSPGSPFDTLYAVRQYLDGTLALPRMYLYPTARCNCDCPICQFKERHRCGAQLDPLEARRTLDTFHAYRGDIQEQALVVSGDGEPLLYPALYDVLGQAISKRMRVFLTTNLTIKDHDGLYEMLVQCSMITVSIKGLTAAAYARYQGLRDESKFDEMLRNLERLLKLRESAGRGGRCLIGVASLILPENTLAYCSFIDRAAAMGIDYLYFNQVEPSCARHGIRFTEAEKAETLRQFGQYATAPHRFMTVRVSADPFQQRGGDSVYYDASKLRENRELCGSALLNPLVLADADGKARWLSCRNSDLFGKSEFAYRLKAGKIDPRSIARVMEAARGCRHCRLERQVRHLDKMVTLTKQYHGACESMLVFDLKKLKDRAYSFISFESVVR